MSLAEYQTLSPQLCPHPVVWRAMIATPCSGIDQPCLLPPLHRSHFYEAFEKHDVLQAELPGYR
jgi:hypothetical protein